MPIEKDNRTFDLMAKAIFFLYDKIFEIFATQTVYQRFDLENEGQCRKEEKLDWCYSAKNVTSIFMFSLRILADKQHTFT